MARFALPALLAFSVLAGSAEAAEPLRIGFLGTLSGPQAVAGLEQLDTIKLAIREMGNKLGGLEVQLVVADDQGKPDVGLQAAKKIIGSDHVQIVTGLLLSNVALAAAPTILGSNTFLISTNAGPSLLAGKECSPDFFSMSFQGDNVAEAMGEYLRAKKIDGVALIAANYAAGHDMLTGFKRFYKSEPSDETYLPLAQFDFSTELTKLSVTKPKAVFVFLTGEQGINFVKQFASSGLRGNLPFYTSSFTLDQTTLPAIGDGALGTLLSGYWSETLDNAPNKQFVAAFRKEYNRIPSAFAATAWDTVHLIAAALRKVDGNIADRDAFRAALASAPFQSVRGKFRFNTNHFPIQDYYLLQTERDASGNLVNAFREVIMTDHGDAYASQCPMK